MAGNQKRGIFMARVTISGSLPFVDSKYELGMVAAQRVRDLNGGERPVVFVPEKEKPTITALREIESGNLDVDILRRELVQSNKKTPVIEEVQALESETAAPELKEFDAELSGMDVSPAVAEELADELADESEGTETVESIESGDGAVEELPQD